MYVHVKVVVIYHGGAEEVYRLALAATDGAWDAGGEVRVRRVGERAPAAGVQAPAERSEILHDSLDIPEASVADLAWADVALFGTAARDGVVVDRLRQFADSAAPLWRSGQLADKVFGAFTAVAPAHGVTGSRLVTLTDLFHQWGGIVVPLGARGPESPPMGPAPDGGLQVARRALPDSALAAARCQGHRATETARELKTGRRLLADVA